MQKIDIEKLKNKSDGTIVNYINTSLQNRSYYLYKSNLKFNHETTEFNDDIKSIEYYLHTDENIELYSLLNSLNEIQKIILIDKYVNKLTDIEIASKLKISRQSVYKNKIKALSTLKNLIL